MNKKSVFIYALIFVLMFSLTSFASNYSENVIRYYNNIKIKLNGQELIPKDENGNIIEPFVINGTTYLPVRAIGNALGLDVNWDNSTNTVLLNKKNVIPSNSVESLREKYGLPDTTNKTSLESLNELRKKYGLEPLEDIPQSNQLPNANYDIQTIREQMNANGILDSTMTSSAIQQNQNYNIGSIVYITNTGSKYHRSSCSYLRQSKIQINESKAIRQGYTPCSRCNP